MYTAIKYHFLDKWNHTYKEIVKGLTNLWHLFSWSSIGLLIINETTKGLEEWTTSILMAMGGLGGAFLPRIVGELIDRYSISVTLWALVVCAFILVSLMAVIFYFRKKAMDFKGLQAEKVSGVV